jgi:hypothetical protein
MRTGDTGMGQYNTAEAVLPCVAHVVWLCGKQQVHHL